MARIDLVISLCLIVILSVDITRSDFKDVFMNRLRRKRQLQSHNIPIIIPRHPSSAGRLPSSTKNPRTLFPPHLYINTAPSQNTPIYPINNGNNSAANSNIYVLPRPINSSNKVNKTSDSTNINLNNNNKFSLNPNVYPNNSNGNHLGVGQNGAPKNNVTNFASSRSTVDYFAGGSVPIVAGGDNSGRTPRQQQQNNGNTSPIGVSPQNGRPGFSNQPQQQPGLSPHLIANPNSPFQPDQLQQPRGLHVAPSAVRPEVITLPLTNLPNKPDLVRITSSPSRPQPQQPRPPISRPPPQLPNPAGGMEPMQVQIPAQPSSSSSQSMGGGAPSTSFQPLIITPVNVSRPRIVIPPQAPGGGLAPIQTPNGRLLLESYPENFCDMRQFSDDQLAARSLQRIEYFVANLSCSRYFFECAVGQTFLLNCTSKDQVYDINTVNCNFRRNVKTCPEYDHILHCTIREQCQMDQFACCATPQTCIPYIKRCDGTPDCQDGDDENNCPSCEPDEFPCVKSGRCIKLSQRCNGIPDECFDQSNLDEIHCQGCGPNKFYCTRSDTCVDLNLRCNGVRECPRGEDELNCKMKGPKYLLCENQKQSVAKEQWCDGYEDCVDGSDEKYCIF